MHDLCTSVRMWCGAPHTDEFEVDEGQAFAVMKYWALWMSDAAPFQADGRLTAFWQTYEHRLDEQGQSLTSAFVIGAWREQQAEKESLVAHLSRLDLLDFRSTSAALRNVAMSTRHDRFRAVLPANANSFTKSEHTLSSSMFVVAAQDAGQNLGQYKEQSDAESNG